MSTITYILNSYAGKLAHVQVVINCRHFVAQMGTSEETLAHSLGMPNIDDVMSYNSLTTIFYQHPKHRLQQS